MRSGEEYFEDEEFREMLEEYEQAVTSGQPVFMDADDLADIADYYQQVDRYDDAQQALDRAIELQPDSVVALNYQIHQALDSEDYDAAEDYLSRMIDHELPEYVYCRAEIWIAQGQVEKADRYLRQCFRELPPDECQDFVFDVANLYIDYDNGEKALAWLMRGSFENNEDFKELMGRAKFGMGNYDDSERIFKELIDRDPFEKRYWTALAHTQLMKQDYGASVTSSEFAIAIDPDDAEGIISKADGLYHLGNYEEALVYFERYSEKIPDDDSGHMYQGSCLIYLGRYEEAIERLKVAAETSSADSPNLVEIYQELAFAYTELKQPDEALYYLDKTDALECDHADIMAVKGHVMLANNRAKEAYEYFTRAIEVSTDHLHTYLRIVVSLFENHYAEVSFRLFERLFNMAGSDWKDGYSYMALCCYDLHRDEQFLHYLKLACDKNPKEARLVLASLFPEGLEPSDYYDYMAERMGVGKSSDRENVK